MKRILIFLLLFPTFLFAADKNTDRYVIVVSADGFRWDYSMWYDTPFIDRMASEGVESGLVPCFPSKTFPNHYSLATGLTPDHHGIIANSFLERSTGIVFSLSNPKTKSQSRFWGGEPIWLTAKKQGVRTAVFYWPGSDVAIQGELPDVYHVYDQKPRLSMQERMKGIVDQLRLPEKQRPHLIMAYLEEPDHSGHNECPHSKATRKAVMMVDTLLGNFYADLQTLPIADKIDFIFVSDHGMAIVTPEQKIHVSKYIKREWVRDIEGNMPANIYANEGCTDSIYNAIRDIPHLSVWRKNQVESSLGYGTNPNCGDIIASPDLGWIFCDDSVYVGGMHGFDPAYNEMHAVFRAVGPHFRNISRPHFRNVNVYPLICHILGIKPADNDGSIEEVKDMLK